MSCCVGMRCSQGVKRDLMVSAVNRVAWDLVVYEVLWVKSGFVNVSGERC